jgi:hypothetical protein
MSEETTTETTQAPENQNVNISIEQILAAVLQTSGSITVKLEDLVANYSTKQIAVNQNEDQSVTFQLADAPAQEEAASESESVSE